MFNKSQIATSKVINSGALLFSASLLLAGCASTEEKVDAKPVEVVKTEQNLEQNQHDPYENFNRSMYGFNMKVDKHLLKPVADGYKYVTPVFVQSRVTNFFTNLKGINVFLNDILQGKFKQGASDAGRFTTNSTLGLLGLFDVATDFGFESNVEDFGQTLAVWGVEPGAYLVLPIMGPTTMRDGPAVVLDKAANPGTYVPGSGIVEGINDRANAEGALNFIDEAALDPYVFMRESFLQYRTNLINDGKTDVNSYDLDLDEALAETSAKSTDKEVKKDKSAPAKPVQPGQLSNSVSGSMDINKSNNTAQVFNEMSASFDQAEKQFASANEKINKISKKKRAKAK